MLGYKRKQGDKGHTARVRYSKIHKILPIKMVWSRWKNANPKNSNANCNSNKGRGKEKRKAT